MRALLVRGLIAGLVAGLAAALFAFFLGEPPVDAAIAVEEAAAEGAAHAHGDEEELVSRDVQSTFGLLVANSAVGIALGGLFAVAFAFAYGRFGAFGARVYSAVLAAGAFVAVTLVPFLKYPANPPAVGKESTIGTRTELYFSFLGISVIAAGLALVAGKAFADRLGGWLSGLLAVGGYLVVMAVCGLLMPSVDEVADGFPASVLWDFRVASLGTLLVLWSVLGVVFGALAHRTLSKSGRAESELVTT